MLKEIEKGCSLSILALQSLKCQETKNKVLKNCFGLKVMVMLGEGEQGRC